MEQLNCAAVATDTFCERNQGRSVAAMQTAIAGLARARDAGRYFGVTIAAAFGCPFEGEVPPARVVAIARELVDCGVDGCAGRLHRGGGAVGRDAARRAVGAVCDDTPLRVHFHNTRNTAIANVAAAVAAGVRRVDASCGGVGVALRPGATGNVGTEDVVYLLERMGYATGIDLERWSPPPSGWKARSVRRCRPPSAARACFRHGRPRTAEGLHGTRATRSAQAGVEPRHRAAPARRRGMPA